jgi:hypothetical protein
MTASKKRAVKTNARALAPILIESKRIAQKERRRQRRTTRPLLLTDFKPEKENLNPLEGIDAMTAVSGSLTYAGVEVSQTGAASNAEDMFHGLLLCLRHSVNRKHRNNSLEIEFMEWTAERRRAETAVHWTTTLARQFAVLIMNYCGQGPTRRVFCIETDYGQWAVSVDRDSDTHRRQLVKMFQKMLRDFETSLRRFG